MNLGHRCSPVVWTWKICFLKILNRKDVKSASPKTSYGMLTPGFRTCKISSILQCVSFSLPWRISCCFSWFFKEIRKQRWRYNRKENCHLQMQKRKFLLFQCGVSFSPSPLLAAPSSITCSFVFECDNGKKKGNKLKFFNFLVMIMDFLLLY